LAQTCSQIISMLHELQLKDSGVACRQNSGDACRQGRLPHMLQTAQR
jgi:hypothetical protein